jgi:hypothetical protein
MKIKYSVTFIGELNLLNGLSANEIVETIEEDVYDRSADEIDWEVIDYD